MSYGSLKLQSDIDTLAARLSFKFYREPEASVLK